MQEANYENLVVHEAEYDIDYYAVFTEEAYILLTAEREENDADVLFAKVDNLLNIASEMLEYQQYLDLVFTAMRCNHNHDIVDMLRQGQHGQNLQESEEAHKHGKVNERTSKVRLKSKEIGKTAFDLYTALMGSNKQNKTNFFEKLFGLK